MPAPDHAHGDRRGAAQRPEDDAVATVLGGRALGRDPDSAAGRDDRQPVVDVVRVWTAGGWAAMATGAGGGAGAADRSGAVRWRDLAEPDRAPAAQGSSAASAQKRRSWPIIGAGEAAGVGGGAHYREVAQALGEAAGGRVGADQLQVDVGVAAAQRRWNSRVCRPMAAQAWPIRSRVWPVVASRDQVVGRGQHLPGVGEHLRAGGGRGDARGWCGAAAARRAPARARSGSSTPPPGRCPGRWRHR